MNKIFKTTIILCLSLGMIACGNSEPSSNSSENQKEVETNESLSKDYNIVFIDNELIKAEWISVEDNVYTIEVTNQSDQNLYVMDSDYPLTNHSDIIDMIHSFEMAPGDKENFSYIVNGDIDCLSIELEASFHDGKDGDQAYIGAFCLLPKENIVVPFDVENCEHSTHKHNNPELFKNDAITINYVTTAESYNQQMPVISITSNDHEPIDWWMFIMDVTNDQGESTSAYGNTSLYTFVENGIRYVTLYSDTDNWEGTWNFKVNSTDGEFNFSFELDENGNIK